jgi:hypothetical protein
MPDAVNIDDRAGALTRMYIAEHGGFDAALAAARAERAAVLPRLEQWNAHRGTCGLCGAGTQVSELQDVPGDLWVAACPKCRRA